jgi:predicted dienelactone hydrolase
MGRGAGRRLRQSAPIAMLIAVAQALVEGPRWQMGPAYALAGLSALVWRLRTATPAERSAVKVTALGALGEAVSIALPAIMPVFRFPRPSGPYDIGTLSYHWVDADRPEVFSADPDARRELMVQLWYPAKRSRSSTRAPYVTDAPALARAAARQSHLPAFLFTYLKYVTTNAIPAASMAGDQPSYPVLILLEGLYGFRQANTFQVEELVSHGYIVAAIDQPYIAAAVAFPDGREVAGLAPDEVQRLLRPSISRVESALILNGRALEEGIVLYLAQDALFVLDRLAALNQTDPNGILTGRLDLGRAGIVGVSLGGIVAAEACRLQPRLRACLIMESRMPASVVRAGLRQPVMWITRGAETMQREGWAQADIDEHQTTMRAVFESLRGDGYFVRVDGMFHLDLTDAPCWSPLTARLRLTGPIGGKRAHCIINAYSLAFFDRHLKGHSAALLDGPAEQYPEVLFERRQS